MPFKEKIPEGITLRELLKNLPQEGIYDFTVNIPFYWRIYEKRRTKEQMELRVVCIWNEEKVKWHIYLSNLSNEQFSAEEILSTVSTRLCNSTIPSVNVVILDKIFSSVDFPASFLSIIPITSLLFRSNETSLSAQNSFLN
jgi:hypothetical protein